MQGHLAEDLKLRMAYIRKPDGAKRGKGSSKKETIGPDNKTFPQFPSSTVPIVDDRAAYERHNMLKLSQQYKHGRPNKQVRALFSLVKEHSDIDSILTDCFLVHKYVGHTRPHDEDLFV